MKYGVWIYWIWNYPRPTSSKYITDPVLESMFAKDRSFGVDKVNPWGPLVAYYPEKGHECVYTLWKFLR